jgi:hypothetical protein
MIMTMLIAALAVGAIAWYYLGRRAATACAVAAAVLFLTAQLIPPLALFAYGTVAVGLVGLFVVGPRIQARSPESAAARIAWVKVMTKRIRKKIGL